MSRYHTLADHFRRLSHLDHFDAIVGWDEAVMMPVGGGQARADAMATFAALRHAHATAPALGGMIDDARDESLDPWQARNLEIIEHRWRRERALPSDLVSERTKARAECEQAWRRLRPQNDWKTFEPLLARVVEREREAATAVGSELGLSPYDAAIDAWDPGLSQEKLEPVFSQLGAFLPGFIDRAVDQSEKPEALTGPFAIPAQRELARSLATTLGFDLERRGRIDESHHPFCGGVAQDVRITTRYQEDDFVSALMGVIHETGHGCYEQSLPRERLDQPVGTALGMAAHESQSLLFEMQIGRSPEFLDYLASCASAAFPERAADRPKAFSTDNLRRTYHQVHRSFIRVDADEATYPVHILLRYDIERELFAGKLEVVDIPERWDQAMRERLSLSTADNFRDGCMQDVHWPAGLFGYFPSYTIGAMIAAQLMAAMRQDIATLDDALRSGNLTLVHEWLRERVWSKGSLLTVDQLLQEATGKPLQAEFYLAHLTRRYLRD